jgi:hypothetical protein
MGHEISVREWRYSSSLSLTSALDGVADQRHDLAVLPPEKKLGTDFRGGWVGPGVGLDGCGKCSLHRDSISEAPSQ